MPDEPYLFQKADAEAISSSRVIGPFPGHLFTWHGTRTIKGLEFLAGVDPDIPWHVTAYHQDYKMTDNPNTDARTLLRAYELGKRAGLRYIYPGNIPGRVGDLEGTHCPQCNTVVVGRSGFRVTSLRLADGKCPQCSTAIPGIWSGAAIGGSGIPRPVRV